MSMTKARVISFPDCNFPHEGKVPPASYDFRTRQGPWAYGCTRHWEEHRATPELGTGIGQELVLYTEEELHANSDYSSGEWDLDHPGD